jgi:hypothetical protein
VLQDTINHWVHHRGQMTVYLRLMEAKVPAIYGPSADENSFQIKSSQSLAKIAKSRSAMSPRMSAASQTLNEISNTL